MSALYFIRHGETDWNRERRLQGQRDVPLNARGCEQAEHCGRVLRDLLVSEQKNPGELEFVSSPLCRARDTMERVRTALALPPEGYRIEPRVGELSFGEWEGFTFAELREVQPQIADIAAREHDKWFFRPPGGESYDDLLARVRPWIAELQRDTILAAHGGVARVLLAHFGVTPKRAAPLGDVAQGVVYLFSNGQVTRFE